MAAVLAVAGAEAGPSPKSASLQNPPVSRDLKMISWPGCAIVLFEVPAALATSCWRLVSLPLLKSVSTSPVSGLTASLPELGVQTTRAEPSGTGEFMIPAGSTRRTR